MKRFVLTVLLAAALGVAAAPAAAVDPAAGVFGLARYVPFNADGYIAVAADEAHLEALDGLLARAGRLASDLNAPAAAIPSTFRELLADIFSDGNTAEVDAKLAWAGDAIALATSERDASGTSHYLFIVPLDDRAAAEPDVVGDLPGAQRIGTVGGFTVYDMDGARGYLMFADDVMVITSGITRAALDVLAGGNYPRLSEVAEYTEAVESLPAGRYTLGIYLNARTLIQGEATVGTGRVKFELDASIAVGGTVLDGETLALDAVIVPDEPSAPPLSTNPDFARYVPGTMGASIHGADLAAIVNMLLDTAENATGEDVRQVVASTFGMLGLDFDGFFRWTKGDFALFADLDLTPALSTLFRTPGDLSTMPDTIQLGLVVEAVNAQEAQDFARAIAAVLRVSAAQIETMRLREEDVNGTTVTVLSVDTMGPSDTTVTFEFGIGASDEVFVLGTLGAVREVLSRAPGLPQQLAYIDSARYALPDATTRWVIDGETIANVVGFLVLYTLPAGPTGIPNDMTAALVDAGIDRLTAFVRHATISTAVSDEGHTLIRATITLGE